MSGSLLGLFPRQGGRRRRAVPPGGGGPAEGLPEPRRHRGVFLSVRGVRHRRRCPRRAPVPAVGSDTEKSSSAAHPGRVRWLLLPGLGPVSPMCCSVLCLVTCLALFSSASLTRLLTGTSFLPFFFFFFLIYFAFLASSRVRFTSGAAMCLALHFGCACPSLPGTEGASRQNVPTKLGQTPRQSRTTSPDTNQQSITTPVHKFFFEVKHLKLPGAS